MLPYFLIKGNGTAGVLALLPGLLLGAIIITSCAFWNKTCEGYTLFPALTEMLGTFLGKAVGFGFVLFYASFAVSCLYGFIEVINGHLLLETPRMVIAIGIFLLVGVLSWHGLEDIARTATLCASLVLVISLLMLMGSKGVFSIENLLPVRLGEPESLLIAMRQSFFAYGGLLSLFMVYPALSRNAHVSKKLMLAMGVSSVAVSLWIILALGVFGQYSTGSMIWLPLELARMIQLSSFLERTEALFAILWMVVVVANGGMLVWCVTEGVHQLFGKKKNSWLHWGTIALLVGMGMQTKNVLGLLQLQQKLSMLSLFWIPILLLFVIVGSLRYRHRQRREEGLGL